MCLKNAELVLNFGGTPFKCGPPPGYTGLAQVPVLLFLLVCHVG